MNTDRVNTDRVNTDRWYFQVFQSAPDLNWAWILVSIAQVQPGRHHRWTNIA